MQHPRIPRVTYTNLGVGIASLHEMKEPARLFGELRFDLGIACLLEVGKSRLEAIGEAEEALDVISFYAEEMRSNDGFVRKLVRSGVHRRIDLRAFHAAAHRRHRQIQSGQSRERRRVRRPADRQRASMSSR